VAGAAAGECGTSESRRRVQPREFPSSSSPLPPPPLFRRVAYNKSSSFETAVVPLETVDAREGAPVEVRGRRLELDLPLPDVGGLEEDDVGDGEDADAGCCLRRSKNDKALPTRLLLSLLLSGFGCGRLLVLLLLLLLDTDKGGVLLR